VNTADLNYDLPVNRIAQHPLEPRDSARLLDATGDRHRHRIVRDLPSLLGPGDVVVVNDTRVLPARVRVTRSTGGSGEVLVLDPVGDGWWEALCRPSRKLAPGEGVASVVGDLRFEIGADRGEGRRLVRPIHPGQLIDALESAGEMPLPPYIHEPLLDPDRYQTTYAASPGSAAAPTAGLHITNQVWDAILATGATIERIELVVGLGTFRPITAERVEDHVMHAERYAVAPAVWERIGASDRVVAIGTTTVRTLESVAATGELTGETSIFITPGFRWQVVDLLLTNFHLPRSSLLAMIEAFVGPRWREIYADALAEGYRFLSFGDAMLLPRFEQRS